MYEVKAPLLPIEGLGDQILDELVALYEAHQQDCTIGIAQGVTLGYVEADMLAKVTQAILRPLPKVVEELVKALLRSYLGHSFSPSIIPLRLIAICYRLFARSYLHENSLAR